MRIKIVDKLMEWLEWSEVNSIYALAEKQNKNKKLSTYTSFTFDFKKALNFSDTKQKIQHNKQTDAKYSFNKLRYDSFHFLFVNKLVQFNLSILFWNKTLYVDLFFTQSQCPFKRAAIFSWTNQFPQRLGKLFDSALFTYKHNIPRNILQPF